MLAAGETVKIMTFVMGILALGFMSEIYLAFMKINSCFIVTYLRR